MSQKCPLCGPKTAKKKVLPFLALVLEFYFCYGAFFRRVLRNESPCFVVAVFFVGSGCAFLYGFLYANPGVLSSRRFRVSGAAVSGSVSSSLLFLLLLPPFFSWGRPGFSFLSFFLSVFLAGLSFFLSWFRSVLSFFLSWLVFLSSSLSFLSARAGSPLPPLLSSFSLSLSLFLSSLASTGPHHSEKGLVVTRLP